MSDTVIKTENLSKKYIIGHQQEGWRYVALRDVLAEGTKSIKKKLLSYFGKGNKKCDPAIEEFWALKDISFEVQKGDRIGVIGRNGAGKSTLLKLLSRITEPTEGKVYIKGRVASLLEVGTGFHPELTGRENIYLNGAILGMSKAEIKKKFDEIVDFAEIERFLDTPVKRYSSGMYVRLAFAVAAHLEPEILLIDEVLAVGDAQFQKKCLARMGEVGKEGRTVLFVTHNMTALKELCLKTILLDKGKLVKFEETKNVINHYLQHIGDNSILEQIWDDMETAPGNDIVRFHRASMSIDLEKHDNIIKVDTPLQLIFEYWNLVPNTELNLSMHVYNREGLLIFASSSLSYIYSKGLIRSICYIPDNLLNDEAYSIMILVVKDRATGIFKMNDVFIFDVKDKERTGTRWYGKVGGVLRPKLKWESELIEAFE